MATITGTAGKDKLIGSADNDTLLGLADNDTLNGGLGVNYLVGGAGNDILTGSGDGIRGNNIADYRTASERITVTLGKKSTVTGGSSVGVDTLLKIDSIFGTGFNDTFNVQTGWLGSQYSGYAGTLGVHVAIRGGAGDDIINGNGYTEIDLSDATGGVTVDIADDASGTATGAGIGTDTFTGVRGVRGSNFDDVLDGSNRNETFRGNGGNDRIYGRGGNDRIDYKYATDDVNIDLGITGVEQFVSNSQGYDLIVSIENARGGAYNDSLIGNDGDNILVGMEGNDILIGRAGNDTLDGGLGIDSFVVTHVSGGNDVITDAGGEDALAITELNTSYYLEATRGGTSGKDLLLTTNYANGTQIITIKDEFGSKLAPQTAVEWLFYSDQNLSYKIANGFTGTLAADLIVGTKGNETLIASGSSNSLGDLLYGGLGNDTLISSQSDDQLYGGMGNDTYKVQEFRGGNDVIYDTGGKDTLEWEDFNGDNYLDFQRSGSDLVINTYALWNDNQTYDTELVQTTLFKGFYTDAGFIETFRSKNPTDPSITVSFARGMSGANGNDLIVGTDSDDTINGYAGIDIMFGGAGNDTINGGLGNDQIEGGLGIDQLRGDKGADTFVFKTTVESTVSNPDVILDFNARQGDIIKLHQIDENTSQWGNQDFTFTGTTASAHSVWYSGDSTGATVYVDVDGADSHGDVVADMAIRLVGVTTPLTADNFDL